MARTPLIRFRYAIEKAAKAGIKPPQAASQATTSKIPAPPGVTRTSTRIEKPIPRAKLTEEEMDAIMLGGAI